RVNPFDWEKGFPQVFSHGGFDAVIGNPPYLKEANNKDTFEILRKSKIKKYCVGKMDIWYAFACKSLDITKENGFHSFIATNNWITSNGATILREKFLSEAKILSFVDFSDYKVFEDASIQTMIFVAKKILQLSIYDIQYLKILEKNSSEFQIKEIISSNKENSTNWTISTIDPKKGKKPFTFVQKKIANILVKIENAPTRYLSNREIGNGIDLLQDFVKARHLSQLKSDVKVGDGVFILNSEEKEKVGITENDLNKIKPYFTTKEIDRYYANNKNEYWIIYADKEVRNNINKYPGLRKHLDNFKPILTSVYAPYGLHRPREEKLYNCENILSIRKTRRASFSLVNFPCYVSRVFLILQPISFHESKKYLLGILNSQLVQFWLYYKGKKQGDQLQVDKGPLLNIPIRTIDDNNSREVQTQNHMVILVEHMLELHKRTPQTPYEQERLEREIAATDAQIDRLVYNLYGLTEEEIKIVEGQKAT
ncbi:MAG: Eco57I restriction-modification methylase domain-containing protein, partial [Candidatus Hodarchaeales archaeon]